jgi:hypothetical protein
MSDITRARELLAGLAEQLGLETLLSDEEDMALLEFDDAPAINLALEEDGGITLTAYLGEAPKGNLELAEELLASNLNWRDTDGATLSMERQSRGVFLARRWAVAELVDGQGLSAALEQFILLAQHWIDILPQLSATAAGKDDIQGLSPDFASLRA